MSTVVFSLICIIVLGIRIRNIAFSGMFADGPKSFARFGDGEGPSTEAPRQKVLTKAVPRVMLPETDTHLRDIQNVTLGVC